MGSLDEQLAGVGGRIGEGQGSPHRRMGLEKDVGVEKLGRERMYRGPTLGRVQCVRNASTAAHMGKGEW